MFDDEAFSLKGRDQVGACGACCAPPPATRHPQARRGRAHWEAHYLFSATGRKVHNIIDGRFTFTPDGLIATHRDRFSFWRRGEVALQRRRLDAPRTAGYALASGSLPPDRLCGSPTQAC